MNENQAIVRRPCLFFARDVERREGSLINYDIGSDMLITFSKSFKIAVMQHMVVAGTVSVGTSQCHSAKTIFYTFFYYKYLI